MTSPAAPPARRSGRAPALPPDERRQAILDAVLPLVVAHGAGVTTRQLAEAAGVAEGTLFRVFEDKAALLHAAARTVLDPARTRLALAQVDPGLDLHAMVVAVAEHLLAGRSQVMAVLVALRGAAPESPPHGRRPHGGRPGERPPPGFVTDSHAALLDGLTELFARHAGELRVPPRRAALALRALVFGARQPWVAETESLAAQEIAGVLVCGIRAVDAPVRTEGEGPC